MDQLLKATFGALQAGNSRAKLYLAYAVSVARGERCEYLESRVVRARTIEAAFEHARSWVDSGLDAVQAFKSIEDALEPRRTTAYWVLTYAIAIYMWHMAARTIDAPGTPRAHRALIRVLDELLRSGRAVDVIDFNYDCVIEHARATYGSIAQFDWKTGRERLVFSDTDEPLSRMASEGRFQPPLSEDSASGCIGLVKPHGDCCTFLRGYQDVYYRGGRHSHALTATLPPRLTDIGADDSFVRSSIMPPTKSAFRHRSDFYAQEQERLVGALQDASDIVVIGWSASGPDSYYADLLADIDCGVRRVHVIDRGSNGDQLQSSVEELFGKGAVDRDRINMTGFTEESVGWLRELLVHD